jgi:hypothetical protein
LAFVPNAASAIAIKIKGRSFMLLLLARKEYHRTGLLAGFSENHSDNPTVNATNSEVLSCHRFA